MSRTAVSQVAVALAATQRGIYVPSALVRALVASSTGSFPLTTDPRVMAARFSQDPLFEVALNAMPEALSMVYGRRVLLTQGLHRISVAPLPAPYTVVVRFGGLCSFPSWGALVTETQSVPRRGGFCNRERARGTGL